MKKTILIIEFDKASGNELEILCGLVIFKESLT